nr:hydantoinase B/oxoprolinase family protein [Desulfurispira natronophila]
MEVFKNRFTSIAQEMGVTLMRTAFSPNIKERRDFSCALFDHRGMAIAQAEHIPVHLGSMPLSVQSAIEQVPMEPGDMVMLNDPFQGGTHLPDITIVAPVYLEHETFPRFYVANRAHHADIGGMSSGSMPLSTSLYQEGVIIPPLKVMRKGEQDKNLLQLLLANVRTPQERKGDFAAQVMANLTGVHRLQELVQNYGSEEVCRYGAELINYSHRMMEQMIVELPCGEFFFEDMLDDDGVGNRNLAIRLHLKISDRKISFDFSHSDPQVSGSVNAVRAITVSCVLYAMRCLLPKQVPTNSGLLGPLEVVTSLGTITDATFPAAVAGGNVETSQRIVDVIFGALAQVIPDRIPAASQGTMNNITIGGVDFRNQRPFAYYETIGGGMGASSKSNGQSAVHSHMTNTLNTPIEALEYSYPFRITRYSLRRGSGGKGRNQGGDGIVRELELLCEAEVTVLSERRIREPYGAAGGANGLAGRNTIVEIDGSSRDLPGKFRQHLNRGQRLHIETPGGGGWGTP